MSISNHLADKTLLRQQCYIDGQWVMADDGSDFPVINPADGTILGRVPNMGSAETGVPFRRLMLRGQAGVTEWQKKEPSSFGVGSS